MNNRRLVSRRSFHRWQAHVDDEQNERDWDAIVRSPKGQATLRTLVAQARDEIARGEVEDGGFGS